MEKDACHAGDAPDEVVGGDRRVDGVRQGGGGVIGEKEEEAIET